MSSHRPLRPRPWAAVFVCALLACGRKPPPEAVHTDDLGREVRTATRIERVVTLAPNLTEIVFAAGAGEWIVGTDDFSDHPPEAKPLRGKGGHVALSGDVDLTGRT